MRNKDTGFLKTLIDEALTHFPNGTSKKNLAEYLRKYYPLHFNSVENARTLVRYYCGSSGKQALKQRENAQQYDFSYIPPQHNDPIINYKLPKDWKHPLILSDIHIPFQDNVALQAALAYGLKNGCDGVVLLGDTMDMYQASTFLKNPTVDQICYELEMTKKFLAGIKKDFGRFIFMVGNHDLRWQKKLMADPSLFGIKEIQLRNLLGVPEEDWIERNRCIEIGKLYGVHGHEMSKGMTSPVNPARGLFLKTGESAFVAHHHRTSEQPFKRPFSQTQVVCYSIGCLCILRNDYDTYNQSNHGFADVIVHNNGDFEFHNHKIINGKVF